MLPFANPMMIGGRPNVDAVYLGFTASGGSPVYTGYDHVIPGDVRPGDLALLVGSSTPSGWTYRGALSGSGFNYADRLIAQADLEVGLFHIDGNASLVSYFRGPIKSAFLAGKGSTVSNTTDTVAGIVQNEADAAYVSYGGASSQPVAGEGFSYIGTTYTGGYDPTCAWIPRDSYASGSDVVFNVGYNVAPLWAGIGIIALRNF